MLNPKLRFTVCAAALVLSAGAAEVWNSKDYKDWSEEDVQRVLTNSPWAAKAAMASQGGTPGQGRRRGGMGGMGGGIGGMGGGVGGGGMGGGRSGGGYPGGGGYPSGGGYPNGGNSPNGSNYPNGNGSDNYPGGTESSGPVTLRWDSAMPVREALMKEQFSSKLPGPGDPDYTLDKPEKYYEIAVVGLRPPRATQDDSDNADSSSSQNSNASRRSRLIDAAQLQIKNKSSIYPEDVKFDPPNSAPGTVEFLFPRTEPIDLDDKEVTFLLQQGRMKLEHKFKLKEMVFNGKLAL